MGSAARRLLHLGTVVCSKHGSHLYPDIIGTVKLAANAARSSWSLSGDGALALAQLDLPTLMSSVRLPKFADVWKLHPTRLKMTCEQS